MGYLSEQAVLEMKPKIRELAAGVLWLVRDGEIYWTTSQERENAAQYFIDEMAPRVAIGHSKTGQLMMLEIDGNEPTDEGFSIPQMAQYCKELGFVNAVNVDG